MVGVGKVPVSLPSLMRELVLYYVYFFFEALFQKKLRNQCYLFSQLGGH